MLAPLILLLAACEVGPFERSPRERPEEVLARIAKQGPVDQLAGRWKLKAGPAERARFEAWRTGEGAHGAWSAAHPDTPELAELRAAMEALEATRLVIAGTEITVERPGRRDRATFLVDGNSLDEVGRSVVHLATRREDGTEDRLDVTLSGLDEITIARRGRDEPPTVWAQDRSDPSGAAP